ncbi:MAG: SdpI family protein [Rhizobiales bacterium]|nr:SdpI family protein [Hyphomicrobiales bacterium]
MSRMLFSRFNLVLWAALALVTFAGHALVPADAVLPVHWGLNGRPDAFWPRSAALAVAPAMVIVNAAIFGLVGRFAPPEHLAGGKHVLAVVIPAISGLALAIQAGIVLIGAGYPDLMVRIISVGIGVMLILLGNVLPKTQPNRLAGMRLPWMSADPADWRATQRLTGILMMLGGAGLLLCGLIVREAQWLAVAIVVAVLVPAIAGTVRGSLRGRRPANGA